MPASISGVRRWVGAPTLCEPPAIAAITTATTISSAACQEHDYAEKVAVSLV